MESEGVKFLVGANIAAYLMPGESIRVDFDPYRQSLTVRTAWSSTCS